MLDLAFLLASQVKLLRVKKFLYGASRSSSSSDSDSSSYGAS